MKSINNLIDKPLTEIEEFYSEYILGHTRPLTQLNQFEGLFRSRQISERELTKIKSVEEIWYKDQSKLDSACWTSGRCHDFGENFFYGSNDLETTIREINPTNGSYVLIGEFQLKENAKFPKCQFAGIETLRHNKMWKHLLKDYEYVSPRDREIEAFISEEFHKRVEAHDKDRYKFTIAFSKILLKNAIIDAIVYTSVASNLDLLNYGFKAEYVDKSLFCSGIWIYRIERDDKEIRLYPLSYGNIIQNLGNPRKSEISFFSDKIPNEMKDEIIKYGL
jgi:hypothetical protein